MILKHEILQIIKILGLSRYNIIFLSLLDLYIHIINTHVCIVTDTQTCTYKIYGLNLKKEPFSVSIISMHDKIISLILKSFETIYFVNYMKGQIAFVVIALFLTVIFFI